MSVGSLFQDQVESSLYVQIVQRHAACAVLAFWSPFRVCVGKPGCKAARSGTSPLLVKQPFLYVCQSDQLAQVQHVAGQCNLEEECAPLALGNAYCLGREITRKSGRPGCLKAGVEQPASNSPYDLMSARTKAMTLQLWGGTDSPPGCLGSKTRRLGPVATREFMEPLSLDTGAAAVVSVARQPRPPMACVPLEAHTLRI